jgi:hypothetical protein
VVERRNHFIADSILQVRTISWLAVVFLAMTYGAITFQRCGVFGVCLDIGGSRAGAMVGLMNTIAQVGE